MDQQVHPGRRGVQRDGGARAEGEGVKAEREVLQDVPPAKPGGTNEAVAFILWQTAEVPLSTKACFGGPF